MTANAVRAADVVAEARSWIGTPFHWQACVKGVGCDCKGLVAGVARALGLPEGDSLYARMADYGRRVPVDVLQRGLAATLERVEDLAPGRVLLMRARGVPQHLGICTGEAVIHCWGRGRKGELQKVLAHPVEVARRAWPVESVWRFGSVIDG